MDTGGLAQMTYGHQVGPFGPAQGYGSRGKGVNMKRLSVAPPSVDAMYQDSLDQTPRTSRSHLLAGLRTAPRNSVPASAPHNVSRFGPDAAAFAGRNTSRHGQNMPQTATASHFSQSAHGQYFLPEQILAPEFPVDGDCMDPDVYNQLMAQNVYLLQRQQQLQHQLMNVTAAQQQFQGLHLSNQPSVYSQQVQNGVQPVVQAVPGQPGVYSVYNPLTGQQSLFYDQSSPSVSPQEERTASPYSRLQRTVSPKSTPSPQQDVAPLPPPSANAYRPGQRKPTSAVSAKNEDAPRPTPKTPMTGTFGLGLGRAGDHPTRQPRGPPPMDELVAAPTAVHEGSKNFAARQRRRAVHDLVRAGKERTSGRTAGSSSDVGTPTSEGEISFVVSSDGESEATSTSTSATHSGSGSGSGSGSLSGDATFGSFRPTTAIGAERKNSRSTPAPRKVVKTTRTLSSTSYEPAAASPPPPPRDFAAAVKAMDTATQPQQQQQPALYEQQRRPSASKSPLLVLGLASAAEKRKTAVR